MGEQSTSALASALCVVPTAEFDRVRSLAVPPTDRSALFATLCRINALSMIAAAGSGHIGSTFSSLDMVSHLFLDELGAEDVFFSSKGHDVPALYSVLIALGRLPFDLLLALRRLGGLPGHPDVATPGIAANTGSLGMGISKAKGMVLANRLAGRTARVVVMTGDGELQEGQIWESLLSAANQGLHEITVVVDRNTLQSDTFVSRTSELGDLDTRFRSFGWHLDRCDGHDLPAVAAAFDRLRRVGDRPKVLIADTIKGAGVSFMAHTAMAPGETLYRYHSGAPSPADYSAAVDELVAAATERCRALGVPPPALETVSRPAAAAAPAPEAERLVGAYGRALLAAAERRADLVALDADLALDTGLLPFRERYPHRFFECGIAEQDMVSMAGGLARGGLLPVVHSFACFLSARPNEQIYNAASERRKILYVGSLAGLVPGGPGHSHQAVRDIAALSAVPGLVLLEPCTEAETARAVEWCVDAAESAYLRLVSVPCALPFRLPPEHRLTPGQGCVLRDGSDVAVIGYGPVLLSEAWHAAGQLADQGGPTIRLIELPWLNRLDPEWLAGAVAGARLVVTLDNHLIAGGQGAMLAAALGERGNGPPVLRLGVDGFPPCGRNDEVLRACGLDAASLAARIASAWTALAR